MQSKRLTTEPPCITEEVFEECLATDDMLVDYFNEFLSLPTFAQPVKFNSEFGVFEVVNDAPEHLENQMKKIEHDKKPPKPVSDVLREAKDDGQPSKMHSNSPTLNIDPNYNTVYLAREQAIQWIKKERLPAFLGSDCYFEYRLAKLISQVEWSNTGINFIIDSDYYPWIRKHHPRSSLPKDADTSSTMNKFYVSLGQATFSQTKDWFMLAKQSESMKITDSFIHPVASTQIQDTHWLPGQHGREDEAGSLSKECQQWGLLSPLRPALAKTDIVKVYREPEEGFSMSIAEPPSHTQLRVYLDVKWDNAAKEGNRQESTTSGTPQEEIIPISGAPQEEIIPISGAPQEEITTNSGAPQEEIITSSGAPQEEIITSSGAPQEEIITSSGAPQEEIITSSGAPQEETIPTSGAPQEEIITNSGAPQEEIILSSGAPQEEITPTSGAPQEEIIPSSGAPQEEIITSSGAPQEETIPTSGAPQEESTTSGAPQEEIIPTSGAPEESMPASSQLVTKEPISQLSPQPAAETPEESMPASSQFVTKEPISELTPQPAAGTERDVDFHKEPQVHKVANIEFAHGPSESHFSQRSSPFTALDSKGDTREQDIEEASLISSSESEGMDSRAAWCVSHRTYDTGSRHEFERFKKFIKGTIGERYWWLWMDIERLKAFKDTTRQQRQLSKMKKLYQLSSGEYFLSSEVLLRLDLLHGAQWNIKHLKQIQPEVVKPLLLYWGPRFCVTHSTAIETASAKLKLWHKCQERPRVDIDPFPQIVSLLPLAPKSSMPRTPPSLPQESRISSSITLLKPKTPDFSLKTSSRLSVTPPLSQSPQRDDIPSSRKRPKSVRRDTIDSSALVDTEVSKYQGQRRYTYAELLLGKSAAGSVVLGGSGMESMLQSLYLENRAGNHFTHFCEKSGNKLWKNSVYFWFDLQAYHQLFYQETLHPFKICRQAQFLYATYIAPSASMDIGLDQSQKNIIYQRIDPAFEDLFDSSEEHILTVLLEPWVKMMEEDRWTYGKVELVEETRQLDSMYFRKLQALHQESGSKKDESTVADTGLPSYPDALGDEHSSEVPKELAGPKLSHLIHNKEKSEQFWAFLNEHSAGMDLMCWLDIEQFRKMLHKDKEKREEKSKDIKNKYLNKKYFFGPSSPATKEQQEKIMHSGGGWGQILQDRLPAAVLLDVQQCVQKRLEEQWLPLFLADEHPGTEGQAKIRGISEDLSCPKQEKTTKRWKHMANKWVSSASEVIAFRKALMNPVTAQQFQYFVSLQGDLLENGVLFWQEVQKYKDLCHSHCDDATVQRKITAIINCFINSAVPPALQIDIPTEQAKKILEQRKELGPYIFREAQMTIFALLFKFWPKFCKFQSSLAGDKILLELERKKGKKMQKKEGETAGVMLTRFQGKEVGTKSTHLSSRALVDEFGSRALVDEFGSRALVDEFGVERAFSDAYGWQASSSYSKYIEALEQERVLLKKQEDLEKSSSSSFTGASSMSSMKPGNAEKSTISAKKLSDLPKKKKAD